VKQKLNRKVALVTGSGRGIGRATALKLAGEGARLVINDLDEGPANEVVKEIRWRGGRAVACIGSVTDPEFADRFVKTAMDEFQSVDIVINNAGYTWDNVVQKMSDEQWQAMIDCHLTAPFRILRATQPVIKKLNEADREAGRRVVRKIVNISSIAGLFGNAGQINYAAGKAGIVGMTMTLAKEWGRLDTTVNCVAFGFIETRLTVAADSGATATIEDHEIKIGINRELKESILRTIPLGRTGTPEDAAGAIYLFCAPESDYISGQCLLCSGGVTGI